MHPQMAEQQAHKSHTHTPPPGAGSLTAVLPGHDFQEQIRGAYDPGPVPDCPPAPRCPGAAAGTPEVGLWVAIHYPATLQVQPSSSKSEIRASLIPKPCGTTLTLPLGAKGLSGFPSGFFLHTDYSTDKARLKPLALTYNRLCDRCPPCISHAECGGSFPPTLAQDELG